MQLIPCIHWVNGHTTKEEQEFIISLEDKVDKNNWMYFASNIFLMGYREGIKQGRQNIYESGEATYREDMGK